MCLGTFPLLGELFSSQDAFFISFFLKSKFTCRCNSCILDSNDPLLRECFFFLTRKMRISMHPLPSNTSQLFLFLFPKVKHIRRIQMLHLKHIPRHSLGSLFPINVKHVLFRHVLRAWEFLQGHNTTLIIYMLTLLLRPRAKHL